MATGEPAGYSKIVGFLRELDAQLRSKATLYVIGGGAVTLAFAPDNRTADIDAVEVASEVARLGGPAGELAGRFGVYISPVRDITFSAPKGWRDRSVLLQLDLTNLEVRVADAYDVVLEKLARLEQKDIDDILAMVRGDHVEPEKLLDRLNDNLAEVKRFSQYRQNAKLLFSEFLERPIIFKRGEARFI